MLRRLGIAGRMSLLVLVGGAVILGVVVGVSAHVSRGMLERELEAKATALATSVANRLDAVERSITRSAVGIAHAVENLPVFRLLVQSPLRP